MKYFLIVIFLLISSGAFVQDYKLFNAGTKKLFEYVPNHELTYSISFDSVKENGTDSVYYNFYKLPQYYNAYSEDCPFWPGPYCFKQNEPVWIGGPIEYDNMFLYKFHTVNGKTVNIDLTPVFGDTSVFYADSIQKFMLTYKESDTLTILDYIDSVRIFKIIHTDLEGNVINSELNNEQIIVGKELGLIKFFIIDQFPEVVKPIELIGDKKNDLGINKITFGMIYDYQPGDVIQYKEYHFDDSGFPDENYTRYRKHTIVKRTEANDTISYRIFEELFYQDSAIVDTQTITKYYVSSSVLIDLPFERFDGYYKSVNRIDSCGFTFNNIKMQEETGLLYCDIDNVWGFYDTGGPPPRIITKYVTGLGCAYDLYEEWPFTPYENGYVNTIIFFSKDGISCGEEVVAGTGKEISIDNKVVISPNPAKSVVVLTSSFSVENISVFNLSGYKIFSSKLSGNKLQFDVHNWPAGVYIVKVFFDNHKFVIKKLIVGK